MPKMTPLNRFAHLIKHLKNALRGVGIGSCIYVIIESIMHGTINGVEAAGVLTISAVLGLLSALLDIKAKPRAPLILLHFLLCGGCVALMVAMLSALNHFRLTRPSYLSPVRYLSSFIHR